MPDSEAVQRAGEQATLRDREAFLDAAGSRADGPPEEGRTSPDASGSERAGSAEAFVGGTLPASLGDLVGALSAGDLTSAQLVNATLDRIHSTQPTLNAFRCIRAEAAQADAEAADRQLAAGVRLPLLGVPVAIKDDIDMAGLPTSFGCRGEFPPAERDSEVVRRLRRAGAIIVGKTNTPELGQWPFTEGPAFGVCRNPWNLDHTPGGSSGGSAVAVAAGLVPVAVGSDGAGSVRIPAAWTHLVGIKPQRGRISSAPSAEQFNGLTCYGTLGRTVTDAAWLLDALTGSTPIDRDRPPAPDEPYVKAARREPGRLRIGLSLRVPFSGVPAKLDEAVRHAAERLADLLTVCGHDVVPADPAYNLLGATFMPRSMAGIRDWFSRVPDPDLLDPRTLANVRTGLLMSGPVLAAARAIEPIARTQIGLMFRKLDVVLAPTTAVPPPLVGALNRATSWETDQAIVAACPYAWPWNVLGWPSINVPAGITEAGLPIGVQLMGPANSESLLISLAAQLEDVEKWHLKIPGRHLADAATGGTRAATGTTGTRAASGTSGTEITGDIGIFGTSAGPGPASGSSVV